MFLWWDICSKLEADISINTERICVLFPAGHGLERAS
jgi:hypothetical protein